MTKASEKSEWKKQVKKASGKSEYECLTNPRHSVAAK